MYSVNQFRVFVPTNEVAFVTNLSANWRRIMAEKLILENVTVRVLGFLAAVLLAFGGYVWNDITSELKVIRDELVTIKSDVKEHDKSLLTIRQFLKVSNPELSEQFFSSVEKLKALDNREFAVLKNVINRTAKDDDQPVEIVSMEWKEIKEKHNVTENDLDNYVTMGTRELAKLRDNGAL